jgi:hypothetical protein
MPGLPVKPKPRTYLAWRIDRENIYEAAEHVGGAVVIDEDDRRYLEILIDDPAPAVEGEWVVASEDGEDATVYSNTEFQRTYTTA